jgi:hypothetical protein
MKLFSKLSVLIMVAMLVSPIISFGDVKDESPSVWGIPSEGKGYVPRAGGVKICLSENTITFGFKLSESNISFYKQEFSSGKRKPLGFEIELIDYNEVFDEDDLLGLTVSFSSSIFYFEAYESDSQAKHTVGISDPTKLKSDEWYFVSFVYRRHKTVSQAHFAAQTQLVGDIKKLKEEFSSIYANYNTYTKTLLNGWFLLYGNFGAGYTSFNVRNPYTPIQFDETGFISQFNRVIWDYGENSNQYDTDTCTTTFWVNSANDPDPLDDQIVEGESWYWEDVYIAPMDIFSESDGDPDFVVREVFTNHHKKVLRPNEDTEIFTRIKNKGDDDTSKDIGLKYWRSDGENIDSKDDRVNLGTDNIHGENLLPGESKWESKHTEAPSTPGIYNYTVEVDYDDEIDEIHNSNNKFDPPFVFEVKKPQLFFSNFFITGGTMTFNPGNIFQVKVFTDNAGAEPGPDVKLFYYLDGVKIGEDNMRDYNLEPEDSPKEESIYIVAPQTPGPHTIAVRVDPSDNVDEGNDNDNYAEITFLVNDLTVQASEPIRPVINFIMIK